MFKQIIYGFKNLNSLQTKFQKQFFIEIVSHNMCSLARFIGHTQKPSIFFLNMKVGLTYISDLFIPNSYGLPCISLCIKIGVPLTSEKVWGAELEIASVGNSKFEVLEFS